jgi:Arc/MetJ-type ribon-helix-helix transcriptional regulator
MPEVEVSLPDRIDSEIARLVDQGEFLNREQAVEELLSMGVSAYAPAETTDELREVVDEQQERIEELEDLLLDLSTRVADGNSMGVCPDCHGAVIKVDPWFRSAKIKCTECERVFHEY